MKAYYRIFFYAITAILAGYSSQLEPVSSVVPRTAYLAVPNVASSVERLNAVLLDSNVLLRFLTGDIPEKADRAKALLKRGEAGEVRLILQR